VLGFRDLKGARLGLENTGWTVAGMGTSSLGFLAMGASGGVVAVEIAASFSASTKS